jgi:hypothetical protein
MSTRERNRQLCNKALEAVKDAVPKDLYRNVHGYINANEEWLLGMELLIDRLGDLEIRITEEQFSAIRKAMESMGKGGDSRMDWLREHGIIAP